MKVLTVEDKKQASQVYIRKERLFLCSDEAAGHCYKGGPGTQRCRLRLYSQGISMALSLFTDPLAEHSSQWKQMLISACQQSLAFKRGRGKGQCITLLFLLLCDTGTFLPSLRVSNDLLSHTRTALSNQLYSQSHMAPGYQSCTEVLQMISVCCEL